MRIKQLLTLIILVAALGIGGYVIYDGSGLSANEQQLQDYLESGGIEERTEESKNTKAPQPGMLATDFTLSVFGEEESRSLSDFQGDYVILNMWASWCAPCRDEMPYFIQFHEDFKNKGVQVVGVNMTTTERSSESISQFVEDFQIPFPTLMDEEGEVYTSYQVLGIPLTYVLDPDGKVVIRRQGFVNYEILEGYLEEAMEGYEQG